MTKPAVCTPVQSAALIGKRVRFTRDHLGSSPRDQLDRVTSEVYGIGDEGEVAFAHPAANDRRHPMRQHIKDWVYVKVSSRVHPGTELYVGVHPSMFEVL